MLNKMATSCHILVFCLFYMGFGQLCSYRIASKKNSATSQEAMNNK
jgi:hypothetical protein